MRSIFWKNIEYKVEGFTEDGKEFFFSKVEYNETPPHGDIFLYFKPCLQKFVFQSYVAQW
jgi:hypothetical protein